MKEVKEPKIESALLRQMEKEAQAAYPEECCGFLLGNVHEVKALYAAANQRKGKRPRQYEISPHDHFLAEKQAAAQGWEVQGVYHSHPDHPAEPSAHDSRTAVMGWVYLILSVKRRTVTASRVWFFDGKWHER